MSRKAASTFAALCMVGATCQDLAWRTMGNVPSAPGGGRQIGWRSVAIGDANHDGHADLLTLVDGLSGAPAGLWGFLWILSGRDGSLLLESQAPWGAYIRSFDNAGDWNGDGAADFVVGLIDNGFVNHRVEVRSSIDNSLLWSTPTFWPDEVLGDLDVDGDGLKDIIVADEHSLNYLGLVNVYAHSGQLLYQLQGGGNPGLGIGVSLCRIGDVDDDGCDDFVMGCIGGGGAGVNVVVSGRTGTYLRYCYGEQVTDGLCGSLDRCGDLDGDGYDEFVAGSLNYAQRQCFRVFSARTGQPLFGWTVPPGSGISIKVSSSGADLDGDGLPDIVVGTSEVISPQQRGAVYAFSGRDGSQIHRRPSEPPFGQVGTWTAALPAPVGQHTGLMIVPDSLAAVVQGTGARGQISAYRGLPRTATLLGPPCQGTLVATPNMGMQSQGSTGVRVHLSGAPPGAPAILMLGLSTTQIFGIPLPLPVDTLGFPGCSLRTSIDAHLLVITGTIGADRGYVGLDLPHPVPVSGLGLWNLAGQWLVLGLGNEFPGGLTQAVTWRR